MTRSAPVPDVSSDYDELVARLAERVEEVLDAVEHRVATELPAQWSVDRPELADPRRRYTRRSLLAGLEAMRQGALPETCPLEDQQLARAAAEIGAPLSHLLWGYRAGHAAQWDTWSELVEALDAEPARRHALLQRGSRFFFAYVDRLSDLVTQAYTRERERTLGTSEQRRTQLVHELLAGADVDPTGLDYDAHGHHVGVIAWGEASIESVAELARACDRRPLVVTLLDPTTTLWVWLGGSRPLSEPARRRLERFEPEPGTRLAIGREATGLAGFRRTHREAGYARRAALRREAPVVRYDEIALEALAGRDEAEARAFASAELAGIDGPDRRAARLRETLLAYFAAGQNAAATATALGVHEQTVAQRIRSVEERIGRPVPARRAELETALRLQRYLAPAPTD